MSRLSFLILCLLLAPRPGRSQNPPDLGSLADFPADNPWRLDISKFQVHPGSAAFVDWVGASTSLHPDFGTVYLGQPFGIPYVVVGKDQPKIKVVYTAYGSESDPGPYPMPMAAPVEGGLSSTGDRHALAVDKDNRILYELYRAFPKSDAWEAESGARWDFSSNALRKEGWTSADAAGLPIFSGLVRYEEVARGEINHAIRMTVQISQKKYLWPATHQAGKSTDPASPPMGLRFRLRADFDTAGFPRTARVILTALKKYGFIVADNGGNWFFSGAPDSRWKDEEINTLKRLKGSDFQAILSVGADGKPIYPAGLGIRIFPLARPAQAGGPTLDLLGRTVPDPFQPALAPLVRDGLIVLFP